MNETSRIWPIDREGHIANRAEDGLLPEDLFELCHEMIDLCATRFEDRLHSVYLSGEAAWNWPAPAIFRVVLRDDVPRSTDRELENPRRLSLRIWQMTALPVEVRVHGWKETTPRPPQAPSRLQVRLKANARCIAGPDLTVELPGVRPDRATARTLIGDYPDFIRRVEAEAPGVVNEHSLLALSRETALRTLEAAFALIMDREEAYSECADVMAGYAALHWPERRRSLSMAERIARDGVELSLELASFIDHHTRWVREAVQDRVASAR